VESREGRLSVGVAVAWVNPTAGATLPRLYCTKDESVRSDKGGEAAYPLLFFLCFLHALREEEDEEKKGRRALSALRARSSCVSRRSALTRFSSSFFTRFSSWARISSFLRSRRCHQAGLSASRRHHHRVRHRRERCSTATRCRRRRRCGMTRSTGLCGERCSVHQPDCNVKGVLNQEKASPRGK